MHLSHQANVTSPFPALTGASPAVTANDAASNPPSSPGSNAATSTATITANDFLQLLVTELQNQDPTANTDPNEYVDQLVQVNSLQQQIQMNQTLDGGPTLTGASSGVLQELTQMNQTLTGDVASPSGDLSRNASGNTASTAAHTRTQANTGNLSSVSNAKQQAAAEIVASALAPSSGHAIAESGQVPSSQSRAFAQFAARLKANAGGQ